jgi:alkanesulfonate monooxygenase SsuD/methylene tetrahydromethanopterin reductase-like flavin-dependent oxidoreductase (luciferase family)
MAGLVPAIGVLETGARMKFGIFDHIDDAGVPLGQLYADRLTIAEAYDRVGFHGYHVAEHHATPLGVAPSPGVWLAAVAQRTKKLRFGPLVYLLPLYHPIKLLEEICMLDQISGGRMLLGVGRGISPIELRYYGLDPDQTPSMYAEALEVILRGMTNPVLNFEGKYYSYKNVPMEMAPFQTPHPPLWYGLGRAEAVPWAAKNAVNIVGNLPGAGMRALTDRYRAEWDLLGNDPADLPLMGVGRHVVVAQTNKEALEVARRGYDKWRASFLKLWIAHDMMPVAHAIFPERFEDAEAQGRAVAGTPDKVRDFLQQTVDEAGLNYLLCRFAFGDISADEALNSIDLFTRHVMPDIAAHQETV